MGDYEDIEFHIGGANFNLWCNPLGDGTCMFRCFSVFKTNHENNWCFIKKNILDNTHKSYSQLYDIFRNNDETVCKYIIRLNERYTQGDSLCIWAMALYYDINIFICDYTIENDVFIITYDSNALWLLYSSDIANMRIDKRFSEESRLKQNIMDDRSKDKIVQSIDSDNCIFLIRSNPNSHEWNIANKQHYQIIKFIDTNITIKNEDVNLARFW
jgi:hypothetical protein